MDFEITRNGPSMQLLMSRLASATEVLAQLALMDRLKSNGMLLWDVEMQALDLMLRGTESNRVTQLLWESVPGTGPTESDTESTRPGTSDGSD